jgi:hypothetical protein
MTDPTDDTLAQVRAATIATMSKDAKVQFLRSRGWRRVSDRKQQRWVAPNGLTSTLAGAVQIQALADLDRSP